MIARRTVERMDNLEPRYFYLDPNGIPIISHASEQPGRALQLLPPVPDEIENESKYRWTGKEWEPVDA